jgi:hypothetical protein
MTEPASRDTAGRPPTDPAGDPPAGGPLVGPRGCTHLMPDGRPCGGTRRIAVPLCFLHDADSSPEAAQARRLGGLHRRRERTLAVTYDVTGVSTPDELTRLVEIAALDALAAANSLARSRTLLAAVRTGLHVRAEAGIDARLRALEAAQAPRRAAPLSDGLLADAERLGESGR